MKKFKEILINCSVEHYRMIIVGIILVVSVMVMFLPKMEVDTDPENMLKEDEPARVFHNQTKKEFDLSEIVVVGIVNNKNPYGVFNPQTLKNIHQLTQFAKTLVWTDETESGKIEGVISVDMVAPSLVDHISQKSAGVISFEWLMSKVPQTQEEAVLLRDRMLSNPLLKDQMISGDGKALCLYLPLTNKLLSYKVYRALQGKIKEFNGNEEYHITGLPVAEGAIGVEMFTQMGLGSALSMATIFSLLFLFFRKWVLVILPMIIATVSILFVMGLMIACGYPVHILSSMLPIFLMSISMVDTVHVLSEFFDVYTKEKGRKASIKEVMQTLFSPMLYTSLTTAAGFYSLTFAPIPPAQVFGVFLSIGVIVAWIVTILFVPAYIMVIPERRLDGFGLACSVSNRKNWIVSVLLFVGKITYKYAKLLIALFVLLVCIALWGITEIKVNDNYAKRFVKSHPIRKADIALREHFGGIYTAHLVLESNVSELFSEEFQNDMKERLDVYSSHLESKYKDIDIESKIKNISSLLFSIKNRVKTIDEVLENAIFVIEETYLDGIGEEEFDFYQDVIDLLAKEKDRLNIFKRPDVLNYMFDFQRYLERSGVIGKSTSVADVVCKLNQELIDGDIKNFKVPDTVKAVSECYMQYQQGHRPKDLWHLVTPDYRKASILLQFTAGDSRDTKKAVEEVSKYFKANKPPIPLKHQWAGLHYINLVLEKKLIVGFLKSFAGSFLIVFVMLVFLFRSVLWSVLCMMPLTLTLLMVYGTTGLIGKDYDLPIAVLSALSIGMAVDFAIHFLERSRKLFYQYGSWKKIMPMMFMAPARAITRNVLVIAIGFLPLLVAPLIPYKTTGVMLFGILSISGVMTLLFLSAVLTVSEKKFFKEKEKINEN